MPNENNPSESSAEHPYAPTPDLVYRGENAPEPTAVRVFDFSSGDLREVAVARVEDVLPFLDTPALTWIDWVGLQDIPLLETLCQRMGVHPLHVEDLIHTDQRPKVENSEDYTLVFTRKVHRTSPGQRLRSAQLALLLSPTTLMTVRERDLGLFTPVQARLRLSKGRIRSMGCDYLAYSLLDTLIDSYFTVLNELEEEIEEVQDAVLDSPEPSLMTRLHAIRSDLLIARRNMAPLREVIAAFGRSDVIQPETVPFLRDAYEHTIKVTDALEFARDLLNGTLESYMTSTGNRMNETMRLLTVISLVFMPLTFIVGVYGMNFEHMPELGWCYGYLAAWLIMLLCTIFLLVAFRRKRWI